MTRATNKPRARCGFLLERAFAGVLALLALQPPQASAQTPPANPAARGLYNWIHTTADAERGFAFFADVCGIELAAAPFLGGGSRAPEGIRPVAAAGSDPLVWDLTNTHGSRFRTVFMRAANTPFGLELSEFFDIERNARPPNSWDPGASLLIFEVRDLDGVMERLKERAAPVVTAGGEPVDTPAGRSILVRNPDGYLLQVVQAPAAGIARATAPGEIVSTSIALSVADTAVSLAFYRDLLGFDVGESRRATSAELRLHGVTDGDLTVTSTSIPGVGARVVLLEFSLPPGATPAPNPFRWRIQDVGAPQFQLEVAGLDALLARTRQAGYGFVSVGGRPIQRPFGRFVFAIDPDGVLVEFVEPAAAR